MLNLDFLKAYDKEISVNGRTFENGSKIPSGFNVSDDSIVITLGAKKAEYEAQRVQKSTDTTQYKITVKSYMTKKATPSFDFMKKWNDDKPMPLRVMVGEKVKETRGMVYMILHGDITEERTLTCMKCGKPITNPVSQFFGMGPECGNHGYTNPFKTDDMLREAVEIYRKQLNHITWEGWIVKSAIEECEIIK